MSPLEKRKCHALPHGFDIRPKGRTEVFLGGRASLLQEDHLKLARLTDICKTVARIINPRENHKIRPLTMYAMI